MPATITKTGKNGNGAPTRTEGKPNPKSKESKSRESREADDGEDDPEEQLAERAARVLNRMEEFLGETDTVGMVERLEALEELIAPLKGLDSDVKISDILAKVEALKASQSTVREAIRRNKAGVYVSGVEDYGKDFSMIRAMIAKRSSGGDLDKEAWEKVGAGLEYEVVSQATEKARELYAKAGITAGDDRSAGSFIPDQVIPDVIEAIYTKSRFISLGEDGETRVSILDGLVGMLVRIPKFKGGMIAYWIGEEDEFAESQTTTSDQTMNAKKLGVLAKLTKEMRDFAGFGYEQLFRRDMERAAAKKLDKTIMYGSGTQNQPRGITKTKGINIYSAQSGKFETWEPGVTNLANTTNFQADWVGDELTYDDLDEMDAIVEDADLDPDENTSTISNPRLFRRLRRLKVDHYNAQATNQAYLLGMPMIPMARLKELIGDFGGTTQFTKRKPGASFSAPSATGTVKFADVVRGNLGNILVGRWSGVEIDDDAGKGKGFTSDSIYMKLRLLVDLTTRYEQSITVCPDARIIN